MIEGFLSHLEGVRKQGDGWIARCPAHEDQKPSLSVARGNDDRILLYCHAGCDFTSVLASLDMKPGEAFEKNERPLAPPTTKPNGTNGTSNGTSNGARPTVVATYDYIDESGVLLYQVLRRSDKAFPGRVPNKGGGWTWSLKGVRRVLYRLPDLLSSIGPVFIPEGEKDVDSVRALGLTATTNPGGSKAWAAVSDEARKFLAGRRVVVLPDNDEPGREHAREVWKSLQGVAASVAILELPGLEPKGDVSDWIAAGGTAEKLLALVETCTNAPPAPPEKAPAKRLTDLGNARRFAELFGDVVRWVPLWERWIVWNGVRWETDQTGEVSRLAVKAVETIYEEAGDDVPEKEAARIFTHAIKSEGRSRIVAFVDLAKILPGMYVLPDKLDADPYVLNVQNGTIDLRTGQLRPHDKDDYITKLCPVPYDPAATCPTWHAFLEKVLPNPELRAFVQQAVGYGCTGDTSEHVMFLLYGTGKNGKSTLVETMQRIYGDYSKNAESSTFLEKTQDAIRNDIAALAGARFVATSESDGGKRMAESLVKTCTGGDQVTARFLHAEYFTYVPQFKIFFSTNHRPIIRGNDIGIWRRIRLIPFEVTIADADRDNRLKEKLWDEAAGILSWAIQGATLSLKGLMTSGAVTQATCRYQEDMDPIGHFLADRCNGVSPDGSRAGEKGRVGNKALYDAYRRYCEENGSEPISNVHFSRHLSNLGFAKSKFYIGSTQQRGWIGISLTSSSQQDSKDSRDTNPGILENLGTSQNTQSLHISKLPGILSHLSLLSCSEKPGDPPSPSLSPLDAFQQRVDAGVYDHPEREPGDDDA